MKLWYGINDFEDFTYVAIMAVCLCILLVSAIRAMAAWLTPKKPKRAVMMPPGQYGVVVRSVHHGKDGAILTFRIKGEV